MQGSGFKKFLASFFGHWLVLTVVFASIGVGLLLYPLKKTTVQSAKPVESVLTARDAKPDVKPPEEAQVPKALTVDQLVQPIQKDTLAVLEVETRPPEEQKIPAFEANPDEVDVELLPPRLLQPEHGEIFRYSVKDGPLTLAFAWQKIDGADGYEFQISRNSAFTEIVTEQASRANQLNYSFEKKPAELMFWRVRAFQGNSGNRSAWSTRRRLEFVPTDASRDVVEVQGPDLRKSFYWVSAQAGAALHKYSVSNASLDYESQMLQAPHLNISIGYWFTPALGGELAGYYGTSKLTNPGTTDEEGNVIGGRTPNLTTEGASLSAHYVMIDADGVNAATALRYSIDNIGVAKFDDDQNLAVVAIQSRGVDVMGNLHMRLGETVSFSLGVSVGKFLSSSADLNSGSHGSASTGVERSISDGLTKVGMYYDFDQVKIDLKGNEDVPKGKIDSTLHRISLGIRRDW